MAGAGAGRVAVVTGAASGIGRAVSILLARKKWRLVLAGRTADRLREVEGEVTGACDGAHGHSAVITTDMGDPAQAQRLIAGAIERFGRIDALVNNAGHAALLPIEQSDPAVIRRAFDVNAIGPASAIHFAWPHFARQKGGCIVNVSTMGTIDPFAGFFAYASSKAALNVMAASCAKEGEAIGVRAFAVAPGAVETEMLRGLFGHASLPASACLSPEEVASVIVQCIEGSRDGQNGRVIFMAREEAGGVKEWASERMPG